MFMHLESVRELRGHESNKKKKRKKNDPSRVHTQQTFNNPISLLYKH